MKKLLSFVLAFLMLASLVVSASAASFWGKDDTTDVKDNASLSLYHYLLNYKPTHGNNFWWNTDLVQWWYDSCEKCNSYALYYVEDGAILWKCLKADCDGKGTMKVPTTSKPDKDETTNTPSDKNFVCSECKTGKYLVFIDTILKDKVLVDRYYCLRCDTIRYNTVTVEDDKEDDTAKVIVCSCKGCLLTPSYKYLTVLDSTLYAHYECSAGHSTNVLFNEWEGNTWFPGIFDDSLTVHVSCTTGGTYWMSGSSTVEYGDKRTIAFYPAPGYVLTDVVINGVSYGAENVLNLTIKKDTTVRATFAKAYLTTPYTLLGAVQGNGTVTAKKNNALTDAEKISANYYDTVTYSFNPDDNYVVSDVLIDGKSVGAVSTYTFTKLNAAHTVEVIFAYKSPFVDVKDAYADAVRYVTESGIMDYEKKFSGKCYFRGENAITVGDFVSALVEMTDTKDRYDSVDERVDWAIFLGLIDKKTQLSVYCDVQTACAIVNKYLSVLESINEISFNNYDAAKSAKDNAIAISLVSEKGYTGNRTLSRYDTAAVCALIANLEYEG